MEGFHSRTGLLRRSWWLLHGIGSLPSVESRRNSTKTCFGNCFELFRTQAELYCLSAGVCFKGSKMPLKQLTPLTPAGALWRSGASQWPARLLVLSSAWKLCQQILQDVSGIQQIACFGKGMRPQTAVIYMSIGAKSVLVAFQDWIQLSVEKTHLSSSCLGRSWSKWLNIQWFQQDSAGYSRILWHFSHLFTIDIRVAIAICSYHCVFLRTAAAERDAAPFQGSHSGHTHDKNNPYKMHCGFVHKLRQLRMDKFNERSEFRIRRHEVALRPHMCMSNYVHTRTHTQTYIYIYTYTHT